jgi:hypothetical protein
MLTIVAIIVAAFVFVIVPWLMLEDAIKIIRSIFYVK